MSEQKIVIGQRDRCIPDDVSAEESRVRQDTEIEALIAHLNQNREARTAGWEEQTDSVQILRRMRSSRPYAHPKP